MRVEWRASTGDVLIGMKRWGVPGDASGYYTVCEHEGKSFLTIAIIWAAVAAAAVIFSDFGTGAHTSYYALAVQDLVIAVAACAFVVFQIPLLQPSKSNALTQ